MPRPDPLRSITFALGVFLLTACSDAVAPEDRGVDLDLLFAPPTQGEVDQVRAEWASRSVASLDARTEATGSLLMGLTPGRLRVVSHLVDGHRHYGALVIPQGAAPGSLPVLVYAHGGDGGVSTAELTLLFLALGSTASSFAWVVPSFRSEPLRVGSQTFQSGGEPSPWDRDVDDALALLTLALEEEPALDPGRVAVLGASRGGGVGLLMGARDPRIRGVVSFFGPTDFLDPWIREIVEESLRGEARDLPGLRWLDGEFIQPLAQGRLSRDAVRRELVRRSAVLFASSLPAVQIHHGTDDPVVAFSQGARFDAAMQALGRGEPDYEFFAYPGGDHTPLTLPGSIERTTAFLLRHTQFERFAVPGSR